MFFTPSAFQLPHIKLKNLDSFRKKRLRCSRKKNMRRNEIKHRIYTLEPYSFHQAFWRRQDGVKKLTLLPEGSVWKSGVDCCDEPLSWREKRAKILWKISFCNGIKAEDVCRWVDLVDAGGSWCGNKTFLLLPMILSPLFMFTKHIKFWPKYFSPTLLALNWKQH